MSDPLNPKTDKAEDVEDAKKLAEDLEFLGDILSKEDPEFMKTLSESDIANGSDDDSSGKQTRLEKIKLNFKKLYVSLRTKLQSPFWTMMFKPVMVHRYPKQAIVFWLLVGGLGFGVFKLYKSHIFQKPTQLFLTSYADLGLAVHDYDMFEQVEPFFDNVRFSKNVMSLIKMTANIRPSENSSNNPMISFEIVIQGVSNEPIVQIKDREAEFRDLILRVTEDFSYDDLETATGKQQLSDAILAKINANLTDGQVRKVFYKNFVVKP